MTVDGISKDKLEQFTPIPFEAGNVLYRIHRYYCKPLRMTGKCSECCIDCKDNLVRSLEKISGDHVRDPYGLLVWVLRDTVAEIAEQGEGMGEILVNKLGEPMEGNIFEKFLKEFNKLDQTNLSGK